MKLSYDLRVAPRRGRQTDIGRSRSTAAVDIALRADRILDLNGGVYRASDIALYSSFERAEPLTNE
jgi:hypothetical protein